MRINLTRVLFLALIVFLTAPGCSRQSAQKGYDTKKNPDGFPEPALALLNGLEAGELATFDAISSSFGELYMAHPDLLDNQKWQKVVDLLGDKFLREAEQLVSKGTEFYTQAAGLYSLASFARPADETLGHMARLFSAWPRTVGGDNLAVYREAKGKGNLPFQIGRTKRFLFGDSLQKQFAEKYLVEQTLRPFVEKSPTEISGLPDCDQAFLASLGIAEFRPTDPVASFVNPACELAACQVSYRTRDSLWVEAYFVPGEKFTRDCHLTLWIPAGEPVDAGEPAGTIAPVVPTSQWVPWKTYAAGRVIPCAAAVADVAVGLCADADGQKACLFLSGSKEKAKRLPVGAVPASQ
jgi:hypothetical protein